VKNRTEDSKRQGETRTLKFDAIDLIIRQKYPIVYHPEE
jgi:hypothetical protein